MSRAALGTILFAMLFAVPSLAQPVSPPADDPEVKLRAAYERFAQGCDTRSIEKGYAKAVEQLRSNDPDTQQVGLQTLAASQSPDALLLIVPLLDSPNVHTPINAGLAIERIVEAVCLKRRDRAHLDRVSILPPGPNDVDLRPLAWVVQHMLKTEEPNLQSYAASMIGYLKLTEFADDLHALLNSRHPAVSNAAKSAIEMMGASASKTQISN